MIALIAAVAQNGAIGVKGALPWHLPEDLKRFKALTSGRTVLMGRKTFESIIASLGTPLPNRKNVVITRQAEYGVQWPGIETSLSVEDALRAHVSEDIFIIGGGEIYKETIGLADRLFITEVRKDVEGDTYFPEINPAEWQEVAREDRGEYSFVEYARK